MVALLSINTEINKLGKRNSHSVSVDSTSLAVLLSPGPVFFLPVLEVFSRADGLFPFWQLSCQSGLGAGLRRISQDTDLEVNGSRKTGAPFPGLFHFVLTFPFGSQASQPETQKLFSSTSFPISVSAASAVLLYLCAQLFSTCAVNEGDEDCELLVFLGTSSQFHLLPNMERTKISTLASCLKRRKNPGYLPCIHVDHEKYSEILIPTLIWCATSKSCSPWHSCLRGIIALNCLLSVETVQCNLNRCFLLFCCIFLSVNCSYLHVLGFIYK